MKRRLSAYLNIDARRKKKAVIIIMSDKSCYWDVFRRAGPPLNSVRSFPLKNEGEMNTNEIESVVLRN